MPGFAGLVLAHALAVALGAARLPAWQDLYAMRWPIVYFSLCTVVLGVLAFNAATRRLGPLNTMLMLNLVPIGVFAIEASLGRSFSPVEIFGAALAVSALIANNVYLRRRSALVR